MSLKNTQTEKNLLTAFAGESQARNRYTFYAKQAKKDGYEQISAIFAETAQQESQHAKQLFRYLEGGELEICASFPAGQIKSTLDNLRAAAAGEKYENITMYPEFAKVAEQEGFKDIAGMFSRIAVAEKWHEDRYTALADNIESGSVFKKETKVRWNCRKCGFIHEGTSALKVCPVCGHPEAYFQVEPANY